MTLSRWLRDYLYISIGGNRIGAWTTYRNLLITMTLGGLWHGAAWTFLLWGIWHGLALAAERLLKLSPPKFIGWITTMLIVIVGWVLFRSDSLATAQTILDRMFTMPDGIHWYPPLGIGALVCLVVEHLAWKTKLRSAMRLPMTAWYSPVATAVMIWALVLYAPQGFRPFIYFQF